MISSKLGSVITADIVNSTQLGSKSVTAVANAAGKILKGYKGTMLSFHRGDSFQALLPDPTIALKVALALRAETKFLGTQLSKVEADLKISIAIGLIQTPVSAKNAHGSTFIRSGTGLDMLEKHGGRLRIQSGKPTIDLTLDAIGLFADYLLTPLTFKQSEVLKYLLQGYNQQGIAQRINKSQSTINKHIQALGWQQIKYLLGLFQQAIHELLSDDGKGIHLAASAGKRTPAG